MSRHFPLHVIQRKQQLTGEASQSDAFPFPVKRGTPATPGQKAGESFEQSYPKQPFSELVRLGVALAGFIGARRRRAPARPEKRRCNR